MTGVQTCALPIFRIVDHQAGQVPAGQGRLAHDVRAGRQVGEAVQAAGVGGHGRRYLQHH